MIFCNFITISIIERMKKFDVNGWARKPSYEIFRNYADPSFHITANVDVTRLYNDCKINGDSFFLASLYYMTRVANEILEFRLAYYRWRSLGNRPYGCRYYHIAWRRDDNFCQFCV